MIIGISLFYHNKCDIILFFDGLRRTCPQLIESMRDLFMLSYYLGGINIADLVYYNFIANPNIDGATAKRLWEITKQRIYKYNTNI